MNSSKFASQYQNWVITALATLAALLLTQHQVHAITVQTSSNSEASTETKGIFSRMSDEMTAPERIEKERHQATLRKKKQLQEAEQEFQQIVQDDDVQSEKHKRATIEKDNQQQSLTLPKDSVIQTTEDSQINIGELEASIQAKIDAGASKAEILASMSQEDQNGQYSQVESFQQESSYLKQNTNLKASSSIGQQKSNIAPADISKEKVKQIAKKLDIPFTKDLLALGSNEAISDALIEQAMANGKTDAEINEAMASL